MILEIDENLPCFEGHFPGDPVLPAVAILDECAALFPDREIACIRAAKFTGAVRPGMRVEIEKTRKTDSEWDLEWRHDGKTLARISVQLR